MNARRAAAVALVAVAALTGCGARGGAGPAARPTPATSSPTVTPGALPVGPGPQKVYTVEPQPPAGACRYRSDGHGHTLPDPVCTPGATNPAVTQANIQRTICVRGWTATIRPPQSVTGPEKRANAASYSYRGSMVTAEFDHDVPLELGGDPNDPRNLWVQPNDDPAATSFGNSKDPVENAARQAVCAGRLTLAAAQYAMATDWPKLGRQLGMLR